MKTHIAKFLHYIGRPQFVIPGMILATFLCFLPKTEVKAEVIDDNTAVFQWGTQLAFSPQLRKRHIAIPFPHKEAVKVKAKKDPVVVNRTELLATACDGDKKCTCINNAIFKHDSSWATAGVGKRARNPCNLRVPTTWTPKGMIGKEKGAVGYFAKFDTLENGVRACVTLYRKFYHDLPAKELVKRWTSNDANHDYHNAVKSCYVL